MVGHPAFVEEIWFQALHNGALYAGDDPDLVVTWTQEPQGPVRFGVQDDGPPLDEAALSQLFAPFTRLQPDHDKPRDATGFT